MRLLIGGSPCTYWSIAQTKNRETEASGMGWELFNNYVVALQKFKPDYFLYENNKSMSAAIRAQISETFGFEPVCINSALVSAQNRQRLYWVGKRMPDGRYAKVDVEQPEDRGILLRDVLESGIADRGKAYCLKHQAGNTRDYFKKHHTQIAYEDVTDCMVAEPIGTTADGKSCALRASEGGRIADTHVVRSITTAGKQATSGAAEPVGISVNGKAYAIKAQYAKNSIANGLADNGHRATMIAGPMRIATIESNTQTDFDSRPYRVYSPDAKAITLVGQGGGVGAKTGLYAAPTEEKGSKTYPVYVVKDGLIAIKDKQYPIKLKDGCYIIRKLTVTECKRLQTVPEWFEFPVSDSQAYKMLGNGWTVEVIMHLMRHFDGITDELVDVLSMYDGMACGHIALDLLGVKIGSYLATEIDKYAIQTATHNFPDIVELGDAYQVLQDDWSTTKEGK